MHNSQVLRQITELAYSNPHFLQWYQSQDGFDLTNPDHHAFIPYFRGHAEFMDELDQLTEPLRATINKNRQNSITRKDCFRYLGFAKKWLGCKLPPNLSMLTLDVLRSKVAECFPDGPPKYTNVTYKGVLAILRGLRHSGHKVTLKAKLPVLFAQVVKLVEDWANNYDRLVSAVENYDSVVREAKLNLLSVFGESSKAPKEKKIVNETPTPAPTPVKEKPLTRQLIELEFDQRIEIIEAVLRIIEKEATGSCSDVERESILDSVELSTLARACYKAEKMGNEWM